ncbi:MAG: cadmium-translocating P-type ATPase [Bryobacteraceae bacterium]|nr:cadmium-translocating P-type ATPase [Bryobacteraceae bacterium]
MPERIALKIHGMDCAEEVAILKREVGPKVGGEQFLAFDILNGVMTVLPGGPSIAVAEIAEVVNRTGMRAEPVRSKSLRDQGRGGWWSRNGRLTLTIVSSLLTGIAFLTHFALVGSLSEVLGSEGMGKATVVPLPVRLLYLLAVIAGTYYVIPKAWFALRRARPDMNLLMTIAVCGAMAIGEWFEAATVAFLFALSLTLESWSVGRARRAIEKLLDLAPSVVRILENGQAKEVDPEAVKIGTTFVVRPGERIPLDGEVTGGISDVNQAPITGESVAVAKEPGSAVFAGTVNGDGALEIRSTKESGDTTLAHIIRLVGEAQQKRAPSELWVDRFARYYTPAVMVLAIAVLLVPPFLLNQPFAPWIYQALVLLVIACPCALVISTPVSVVAALAAAARNGVLVKGGIHLEAAGHLKAVAMDKTGTLTEGRPSVFQVVGMNGHTETELLARAAAMEVHSDHPLARAILDCAAERGVAFKQADEFRILPGKGATARIDGRQFWLGSHRFLEERGQETPQVHRELDLLAQTGRTVVVIGNEAHVCGFIALTDRIRPESAQTIRALRAAGMQHVVMLTGDNEGTARAIAQEAGVTEVRAELLPEDKVAAIGKLVDQYSSVAMIGDGINDAPAMGRATIGIAMGAAGSDTAIEAADIALMSDDLGKVPWLIQHSRRMLSIIRTNIVLSLAVKAVFVVLTLSGHASLWTAIAADMGVSLLVIFNALRLLA